MYLVIKIDFQYFYISYTYVTCCLQTRFIFYFFNMNKNVIIGKSKQMSAWSRPNWQRAKKWMALPTRFCDAAININVKAAETGLEER